MNNQLEQIKDLQNEIRFYLWEIKTYLPFDKMRGLHVDKEENNDNVIPIKPS